MATAIIDNLNLSRVVSAMTFTQKGGAWSSMSTDCSIAETAGTGNSLSFTATEQAFIGCMQNSCSSACQ